MDSTNSKNFMNFMNSITFKATCLITNDRGELLVTEDYDSVKKEYFCVPLGGHIRFGERAEDAVRRELLEEINAGLVDISPVTVLENFFSWNGAEFHEINFVYKAGLADKSLYHKTDIPFLDPKYSNAKVKWIKPEDFKNGKHILYPEGLRGRVE